MRIKLSVFDQMPQRELEMSPWVPKRVSPPNTMWPWSAQTPVPYQNTAYASSDSPSTPRDGRASRRSSAPHSISSTMLSGPVREALSTSTKTNSSTSSTAPRRRITRASPSHTAATMDHSSRLLR